MSNDNATLTACREALAAMEQAEAVPWEFGQRANVLVALTDVEAPHPVGMMVQVCGPARDGMVPARATVGGRLYCWEYPVASLTRTFPFAPGTLRGWRTLLDMCEAAMLSDTVWTAHQFYAEGGGSPAAAARSITAIARHDFALAILAALADAMGVTGGGNG